MNAPLISVLIPTFNRSHTIIRALRSVLASSYSNIEVIVSDNASSDGTIDLARETLKVSGRPYRIIENAKNEGPVANWVKAFNASSGKLIKYVWSDDAVTDSTLTRLAAPLVSDKAIAFSFCPAIIASTLDQTSSDRLAYRCGHSKILDLDRFAIGFGLRIPHLPVSPGAALIRREAVTLGIHQFGFLPNTCLQRAVGPDLAIFYSGLLEEGWVGICCEDTHVIFYEDATSITNNTNRRQLNDLYDRTTLSLLQRFPAQRDLFLLLRLLRAVGDRGSERSAISMEFQTAALGRLRPRPLAQAIKQLLKALLRRQKSHRHLHMQKPE